MLNDWRLGKKAITSQPPKDKYDGIITAESILKELEGSDDIIAKKITFSNKKVITVIGIDGLIDSLLIDQNILKPIIKMKDNMQNINSKTKTSIAKLIDSGEIPHSSEQILISKEEIINKVLVGFLCVVDSEIKDRAYIFDTKGLNKRPISEPLNENIIKGSKEAFNETLRDNTAIVRKRINSKYLKVKEFNSKGEVPTKISVLYLDNQVDKEILNSVIDKVSKIEATGVLTPAGFEEQIVDNKYSLFPQILYTERVDKFSANIADGEIGIIIDGLSIGYTVPAVMNMFFQVPEDYSFNYLMASVLRFSRYVCAFLTVIVPALYVAITTFHPEMVPTELAVSIIKSKQDVPLTSLIEVLAMLISFEILVEAGERLPKTIGQTISIVGGLIVGEAAVTAKFASPAVVVVVAIAGITGFIIPNQDFANSLRLIRLGLVVLAGIAGMYGLSIGVILLLYYMASIESFGVPYLIPFSSNQAQNIFKDTVVRGVMPTSKKSDA